MHENIGFVRYCVFAMQGYLWTLHSRFLTTCDRKLDVPSDWPLAAYKTVTKRLNVVFLI